MGLSDNPSRYVKILANQLHRVHGYLYHTVLETEARLASEYIRPHMEKYGFSFRTLGMICRIPVGPVEKQVRKFWKEQDQREKKEREEQETAWKYDFDVRPDGEGWFWVRTHQRTSCRGKVYTVRGHWRCRKTKPLEMQNAA
jgi:hypothetical protein